MLFRSAASFQREGWSNKQLIRAVLLSKAWRRTVDPTESAIEVDPGNRFLAHATMRRLEAESIRDSLLWLTGSLKRPDEGPGTRNYYRSVLEPNKQSPPGPIDGDGRRSIYLEVRRNFPDEFLSVFDLPRPIAASGKRTSTNGPLQSLMLLNDPFVVQQAEKWALETINQSTDPAIRVEFMYLRWLSRKPTESEMQSSLDLVREIGRAHV